jgi:hypothetical protein
VGAVLPRIASVVLAVTVLAVTGLAEAGVNAFWKPLGTSVTGNGVSQALSPKAVFDASVAVGPNGRPVVAYTEYPDANASQGAITVKRWTGTTWELLSGASGVGQGYEPQVRVAPSGAIYVAWLKDDSSGLTEIRLRVRTGTTFDELGGSDSTPGGISGINDGITVPFSLALDLSGNPVVAFLGLADSGVVTPTGTPAIVTETQQVYVRRWTGSAWEFVGSDFSGGGASNAVSFVSGLGTVLHDADSPSLTVDSTGAPVVAFTYLTTIDDEAAGTTDIYVTRWNGSAWVAVGPAVPSGPGGPGDGGAGGVSNSDGGSFNPSLAAGTSGQLALAWEEEPGDGSVAVLMRRWNGATWQELAGSATGSGFTEAGTTNLLPQIAIDPDGRPVVTWQALVSVENPAQVFVLRWNGTDAWDELGLDSASNAGISDAALDALIPSLALTPATGVPTVAWLDMRGTGSGQVFLRQLYSGPTFALTTTVTGDGTLTSNPIGVSCSSGETCITPFPSEAIPVTLLPHAGPTGSFTSWSGSCTGSAACSVTMTANRTVTATFGVGDTLQIDVLGAGGRVSSSPVGIPSCGDSCSANYASGTPVTLTAATIPGGTFIGWGGACAFRGTNTTCAVPLLPANVSASFTLKAFRLTVTSTTPPGTNGQGLVGTVESAIVTCAFGDTCVADVGQGTAVALLAQPAEGNRFINWTGGPCAGKTTPACNFTMTANSSVAAVFRGATGVQVLRAGNGSGTVTGAGINCGADCFESIFLGTAVSLTATPAVGSAFTGWTGDAPCAGQASGPCAFTTGGPSRTYSATFTLKKQQLTVVNRPSGNVRNDPAGSLFDCGNGANDCTGVFDYGTAITLKATANPGFVFVNWTGGACVGSTNASCPISLKANVSVTPNFRARTVVTVVKAGNGAGTVSGPGISCGADCSESEFDAKPVTLTAVPTVGSRLTGFSGACTSPTSPCTFTPTGDSQSVTATFTLIPFRVTVTSRTSGNVVDNPALAADHVNCGAGGIDCETIQNFGTTVVLKATPIVGSRFVNWTGGACAGSTNTTCLFKIPAANISVSPNYKDVTAVSLSKIGQGTVVSTPAGISCGLSCSSASFDFARGVLVKLTAAAPVGWDFNGFSGACSGLTCAFNASAPTALVGANFSIQHRRLTITVAGQGSVGGGAACGSASVCAQDFDYSSSVPLTATAAAGHRFTGWSQGCAGVAGCSNLMTVNRSVTATFQPQFSLTVTKPGNSTGTITASASPAGIPPFSCGVGITTCSSTYLGGQVVTLTRSAPTASTDFRWGGDCAFRGTNATCALPLNANASVVANYSLKRLGLEVLKSGPALGTVTGPGIACGSDCLEVVDYGTIVTLTAVPNAAPPIAEFGSWSGCTPTPPTNPSCSFTMTANKTVTATFRPLVTGVTLKAISTSTLAVGGVRQLAAVATFTDGSTQDVTTQALWTSSNTSVATVSATGAVIGKAFGNTSVMGTLSKPYGSFADAMTVAVDTFQVLAPTAPVIIVSCTPYGDTNLMASQLRCLPSGVSFSVVCQATGLFAHAGSQDVTDQVTWASNLPAVAQSTGLIEVPGDLIRQSFRIVGNGTAILRATESGKTSSTTGTLGTNPWVVQGVPSTITGINVVTPGTTNVGVGDTLQLQALATVTSTDPTCSAPPTPTRDFSRIVEWSSASESVADVSFSGEVTGVAVGGPVRITATYPRPNPLPDFTDFADITIVP